MSAQVVSAVAGASTQTTSPALTAPALMLTVAVVPDAAKVKVPIVVGLATVPFLRVKTVLAVAATKAVAELLVPLTVKA